MIKHVVFDFDGTLVDSKGIFLNIYNGMAQQKGYVQMTPDNIEHLRTLSITKRCSYLNIPLYQIPFVAVRFIRKYREAIPLLEFNSGVEGMLKELDKAKVPYSILSSNSHENIAVFFEKKRLRAPDIFCSSNIFGKDRVLAKFLKIKKLDKSDILYVGDELRDVVACRKIGVKIAWVSWGYDSIEALQDHQPDYVIDDPNALCDLVLNFRRLSHK